MRVFSTLVSWSNENKSCMRVDESCKVRVRESHMFRSNKERTLRGKLLKTRYN